MSEYNEGHTVEGFDRVYIINGMLEDLLLEHPAILAIKCEGDIEEIIIKLNKIYQKLGSLE